MLRDGAAAIVVLVVAITGTWCGGGGGGDGGPRTPFEFAVTAEGATAELENVHFVRDAAGTRSGVSVQSGGEEVAKSGAGVVEQQLVTGDTSDFDFALNLDASTSIQNKFDPEGNRFQAIETVLAEVSDRADLIDTRVHTFRGNYPDKFKLIDPPDVFDIDDDTARQQAVDGVIAEGNEPGSPVLTSTSNIIDTLVATRDALLLLTDCASNGESSPFDNGDEQPLIDKAVAQNVAIFVALFGNETAAHARCKRIATETNGAFVTVTNNSDLSAQFRNLAVLMTGGGVVVNATTDPVPVDPDSNPVIRGFMRFDEPAAGCPTNSEPAGDICQIEF